MKDEVMFTFVGHLYDQHGLSLDSEEPGIIQKKKNEWFTTFQKDTAK